MIVVAFVVLLAYPEAAIGWIAVLARLLGLARLSDR